MVSSIVRISPRDPTRAGILAASSGVVVLPPRSSQGEPPRIHLPRTPVNELGTHLACHCDAQASPTRIVHIGDASETYPPVLYCPNLWCRRARKRGRGGARWGGRSPPTPSLGAASIEAAPRERERKTKKHRARKGAARDG